MRRRRVVVEGLSDAMDDAVVQLRAARYAYLMAGGLAAADDPARADASWWSRWLARRPAGEPTEALATYYVEAVKRLDAMDLFDRQLACCRRQAALNTPAARAARQARSSR